MTDHKHRCQASWNTQANCQYAKGDNFPHSECQAKDNNLCKQHNTKLTSALSPDYHSQSIDGSD